MIIKILKNIEDYDNFVKDSIYSHYMKTSYWANIKKEYTPIYLGFFDNNIMIGSALALKKIGIYSYIYIPLGMCIDYTNLDILKSSIKLIKEFAIKEKVDFLRIDPNVIRVSRDINGNQTDLINNEYVTENFKKAGFIHKGYGYAYNGSFTNRYTLIVDLSKDINTVKQNYSKPRLTSLNRHNVIGVKTRLGNIDDIKYIMEFEKELAYIQGFKPHSFNFFKNIIDNFKNNCRIYITEINLQQMIDGINNELSSKKYSKDLEARKSKENELEIAKNLLNKHGDVLVIAAGLFIFLKNKSWDLYTYNRKNCNFIKPVDNLHFFAMNDLKNLGVTQYDMCGFSGSTDKNDKYYGLYNYKKSFNPDFIEMIGEFDYIINNKKYLLFSKITKFSNKIKRKLNSILFKNQKTL